MKRFADRTAVVTGGTSGLGAAMARLFASQGMRVVVADIAAEGAAEVAHSLEAAGTSAIAARVDVGDPASLAALAETTAQAFGGCDLLAANVGVQRIARFDAMTRDEFAWLIHTNVVGTADTVRAFLPQLRASEDAHVLVTGSVGSLVATLGSSATRRARWRCWGSPKGCASSSLRTASPSPRCCPAAWRRPISPAAIARASRISKRPRRSIPSRWPGFRFAQRRVRAHAQERVEA